MANLFKSRRFIVALAALLVGLVTLAVPDMSAVREEILTLVIALALALIGGYSIEDAAKAGRDRANDPSASRELRDLIVDVLDGLFDPDDNTTPTTQAAIDARETRYMVQEVANRLDPTNPANSGYDPRSRQPPSLSTLK